VCVCVCVCVCTNILFQYLLVIQGCYLVLGIVMYIAVLFFSC